MFSPEYVFFSKESAVVLRYDSEWLVFVVVDVIEMTDGCNLAMLMHANTNIIENYNHQKWCCKPYLKDIIQIH